MSDLRAGTRGMAELRVATAAAAEQKRGSGGELLPPASSPRSGGGGRFQSLPLFVASNRSRVGSPTGESWVWGVRMRECMRERVHE
eukprot:366525-Chlamydomonas_euryale.AAC.6